MEQKKSRLLRLTLMGGQARVFICDTTEMAQQARDIHNASNTCSAAMGRMLAATAIMGANLKSEGDRITATINGGGPAGPICAIAGPDGTVKVTIEHPEVELPLKENGKLNVGGALGKDGQLTVSVRLVSANPMSDALRWFPARSPRILQCTIWNPSRRRLCARWVRWWERISSPPAAF
ncbi:MAG: Hsp33 family molecular chaperone HslO [Christensenellales bacterium]